MKIRWIILLILCVFPNIYIRISAAYPIRTALSAGPRDPGEPQSPRNPPQPPAAVTGAIRSVNPTAQGSRPFRRRHHRKAPRLGDGLNNINHSGTSASVQSEYNVIGSRDTFENIPLVPRFPQYPGPQAHPVARVNVTPYPVTKVNVTPYYVSGLNSTSYPVSRVNDFPYPGSRVNDAPYPVSRVNDAPYPVSRVNDAPYPVSRVNDSPYPGSRVNDAPYPVSQVNDAPYPVSRVNDSPYPGSIVNDSPYPVSGVNDVPYPISGVNDVPYPVSRVNDLPYPGSRVNDLPYPQPRGNVTPLPVIIDETWHLGNNGRQTSSNQAEVLQNWDGSRNTRSANGTHQFHHIFFQRFTLFSANSNSVLVINSDSTVTTERVEGSASQNTNPKALLNIFRISNLSAKTVIQSYPNGLYLCMDSKGRVYSSCTASSECEFRYNYESTNYNTIESWKYPSLYVSVAPGGDIRRSKPHEGPLGMEQSFLPISVGNDKAENTVRIYYLEEPNRLQHCANYDNGFMSNNIIPAHTISPTSRNHRHRHGSSANPATRRRKLVGGSRPNGRRRPGHGRITNQTALAGTPPSGPRAPGPRRPPSTRMPNRRRFPPSQSPRNRPPTRRPTTALPAGSVPRATPGPWPRPTNSTVPARGANAETSPIRRRCRVENGREKCKVVKKKRCKNRKCREKRRRRRKMRKLRNNKNIPQQCRHLENMEKRVCLRQNRKRLRENIANSVNNQRRTTSTTSSTTSTTTTTTTTTTTPSPTLLLNNNVLPYYDRNNEVTSYSNGISTNNLEEGASISNHSSERWPFPRTPSWSTAQPGQPMVTSRKRKVPRKKSGPPSPGRPGGRRRNTRRRPSERVRGPRGRNLLRSV